MLTLTCDPKLMNFPGLFDVISEGKEAAVAYFNNWVEEVKRTVPTERLLVFSVKEGWEPLCNFLDVPIPEGPFPNTNDSAQMKKFIRSNQIKAYSTVLRVPVLFGIFTYFCMKTSIFQSLWSKIVN